MFIIPLSSLYIWRLKPLEDRIENLFKSIIILIIGRFIYKSWVVERKYFIVVCSIVLSTLQLNLYCTIRICIHSFSLKHWLHISEIWSLSKFQSLANKLQSLVNMRLEWIKVHLGYLLQNYWLMNPELTLISELFHIIALIQNLMLSRVSLSRV